MSNFVHLHLHTDFSCLDGYSKVEQYAKKAAENNVPYLSVTDHGMGAAYPQMIEECNKYNLKPIFGCEVYTNNYNSLIPQFKDLTDEQKKEVRRNNHLVLIAKNNKGYENLVKIISEGWIRGFYFKPRVDWDFIKENSDGLICCSACLSSQLSKLILNGKIKEAIDLAREFHEVWPDDYYIELMMLDIEEQDYANKILLRIADKLNIPIVITNDVHYCEQSESYNQTIQLLLNSKSTINNRRDGLEIHTNQLWYKTEDELDIYWEEKYKNDIPEAEYLEAKRNTVRICEKCDVQIDTSAKFPQYPNAEEELVRQCMKEMKKRDIYKKEYKERFFKEFSLIKEKDFTSYFLIVQDIVDHAKSIGSLVGASRGSVGGSLIAYLLGITQIDPIKYDLLFERFLSESRGGKFAKLQFKEEDEIK